MNLLGKNTYSQTVIKSNKVSLEAKIDSVVYYFRSFQDEHELTPLSSSDPNYKEPEIEVTFVIYIKNSLVMDSLQIEVGTEKDKHDIKKITYYKVSGEGTPKFKCGDKVCDINNNQIVIKENFPNSLYRNRYFLTIFTTGKPGIKGTKVLKELN